MMRILLISLAFAFLLAVPPGATPARAADPAPEKVLDTVEQGTRAEQAAQKKADAWSMEKESLLHEARELRTRQAWLDFQVQKYQGFVDTQQRTLAELERRKEELETVRRELEPFMAGLVDRLDSFVAADLPMLRQERAQRIAYLRSTLADYTLNLSEKLRRVLEALQVEADYGQGAERTEAVIDLDGEPRQVSLLRLGRLALFYKTPDNRHMGRWDSASRQWVELEEDYRRELRHAFEMADRQRVVELLRLPVQDRGPALAVRGEAGAEREIEADAKTQGGAQ